MTGATGFIGQAVVRAMRARAWNVTALVRDPDSAVARWLQTQSVELVRGDVIARAGLPAAMAGADVVVHNAGVYELGAAPAAVERMQRVNILGTNNVLGAALEAGIARTLYVSTVWALGPTGFARDFAHSEDESKADDGTYLSAYARSQADAHRIALAYRAKGLPLVIALPSGVCGANDRSPLGYFLRLYLLGRMPPFAFGKRAVHTLVDVDALADGLCLAAEHAPSGQDYIFAGEALSRGALFAQFGRFPGGLRPRLWLPGWLMRGPLLLLEPLQRRLGLPAFVSRETVAATQVHLNYSAAKARHDLGWEHPRSGAMWTAIVARESELMAARDSVLEKLRHQPWSRPLHVP